jgi:hypothetical protein
MPRTKARARPAKAATTKTKAGKTARMLSHDVHSLVTEHVGICSAAFNSAMQSAGFPMDAWTRMQAYGGAIKQSPCMAGSRQRQE